MIYPKAVPCNFTASAYNRFFVVLTRGSKQSGFFDTVTKNLLLGRQPTGRLSIGHFPSEHA
jgi:hypothetical protein